MLFLAEEVVVELFFVAALLTAVAILVGTVIQLLRDGTELGVIPVAPPARSAGNGRAVDRGDAGSPSPRAR